MAHIQARRRSLAGRYSATPTTGSTCGTRHQGGGPWLARLCDGI